MKIVIAGGTGLVGRAVVDRLGPTNDVVVLSRSEHSSTSTTRYVPWNGKTVASWAAEVDGAHAIINLAGASIAERRWTESRKRILLSSRLDATNALVSAIERAHKKPMVLVNASASGYYGNVPDGEVFEHYPPSEGFLSEICLRWEESALKVERLGVRVALARTGIVLASTGGALRRLLFPFSMFVGGPLGSGKQWFPWIHLDDEVSALEFIVMNPSLHGAVNLSSPFPVRMQEFCRTLGRVLHRPSWVRVPGFALKAMLGEMARPLLLDGSNMIPQQLLAHGFQFRYPRLKEALEDLLTT